MENLIGPGYEINSNSIMFNGAYVIRDHNYEWKYDRRSFIQLERRSIHEVYDLFVDKMNKIRDVSRIKSIVCSNLHAIALYAYGVITDEMLQSIEWKEDVFCDGHTQNRITIPQQGILFEEELFYATIHIFPSEALSFYVHVLLHQS